MKWTKKGFKEFSKGNMGNGGQNIYVSANGVLQRIFQFDLNRDGYPDLLFANSQSMGECPPVHIYDNPLAGGEFLSLPVNGAFDAIFTDLTGDGYDDLVVACQNNGTHTDVTASIYFASEFGLTEKYKMELPAPGSLGVAAGDFKGKGRNDLAFICENVVRIFYQTELGIEAHSFKDYPIDAESIVAGDLDGDGYDDIYVRMKNGSICIFWGSDHGIVAENATVISGNKPSFTNVISTTAGRKMLHQIPWRASIVNIDGQKHIFRVENEVAILNRFNRERELQLSYEFNCGGAVHLAAGDLSGKGYDDIVIAVCTDRDKEEESIVLWGESGYSMDKATRIVTKSARFASISRLEECGKNYLLLCQGATRKLNSTHSLIICFRAEGSIESKIKIPSEDAARIISGKTGKGEKFQIAVINHESGRAQGDENIYIFLGSEDGYTEDRRIELPGLSAVEGKIFDFNDDGLPDVLISNCAENAPHLDSGSYLYINSPQGFDKERKLNIPSIMGHGAAVGDFRKRGYLDIAIGGINNREIRIFEGGPDGYDMENPRCIVLGPEPEKFKPFIKKAENETRKDTEREKELLAQYGSVRWLFAADFNGDGWLDLFVSQIIGPNCMILWGGPEGFDVSRMQVLATDGAASCNAADLNSNGYLDLVIAGHMSIRKNSVYESYVTIYWGGPEGYCENRKTQLPVSCANSVSIGDFNADGILDIYATSYNNGRIRDLDSFLYFGSRDGVFKQNNHKKLFNHSGSGCMSGDFNGDGYTDLAVACHKGYGDHVYKSRIFWGGPDGLTNNRITELPTVGPHGMTSIDIGNIMDRGDAEYYYSEIFHIPNKTTAVKAYWEAELGPKNSVYMQIRHAVSMDEIQSAPWRGVSNDNKINNNDDLESLCLKNGYIQYRLALIAKCGCNTPRIHSVTIDLK